MVEGADGMQRSALEPFDRLTIEQNTAQHAKKTKQTNNRTRALFELSQSSPASEFPFAFQSFYSGRGMRTNDLAGL